MLNERPYQIIIKPTVLYKISTLIWSFIYFLIYIIFSLAVYEGTVRTRFSVVLSYLFI